MAVLSTPLVRLKSAPSPIAVFSLPRSPTGVGEGVGVGVGVGDPCGFPASAAGETAEQAIARAMRIKAEAELRNGFAIRSFRGRLIEVWISVFIGVIPFLFWFLVCSFCYSLPVPGNSARSSRKFFKRTELLRHELHEWSRI